MTVPEVETGIRDRDRWVQTRSRTLSDDRGGSRSRSNSRVNTNRDRLRCYWCGEYDHFAQECPNTQRIQVGNRQYVSVLFVIPVIIDIHRHRFEIYALVSEIHENVDLVLGIKNVFELEEVTDSHNSHFTFLNRSIPFFPKEKTEIPPKYKRW